MDLRTPHVSAGGNIYSNLVFLVVLSQLHTLTIAAETDYCCRGLDPDPNRMGDVYGSGGLLVFSSRVKCGDLGAPACPGSTRTVQSPRSEPRSSSGQSTSW